MQNDLISRSALIEEINAWAIQCNDIDSIVMLQVVVDVIERQQTAYDVDKVVEQVHTRFENYIDEIIDGKAKAGTLDFLKKQNKEICNLVRNGGKE